MAAVHERLDSASSKYPLTTRAARSLRRASNIILYSAFRFDPSLIAKARTYERGFPWFVFDIVTQYQEQGVDYLVALLTGYEDAPADFKLLPDMYVDVTLNIDQGESSRAHFFESARGACWSRKGS